MIKTVLIIGGSHAGGQLAIQLRKNGWEGIIKIISDEPSIPYHRPPLSKAYLAGEKQLDEIKIRPQSVYEKNTIEFMLNTRVTGIDTNLQSVQLEDGRQLSFTKLALTTGAKVRKINIPGADLPGVCYLRNTADVDVIRQYCGEGKNAVIIGGGYIGLETAAVLRKLNMNVTLLETMPRILQRVTTEDISSFYHRVHTEEGLNIVTDASVADIAGTAAVESVNCADGSSYKADLVIVGIGVLPNTDLAEQAGLEINNGIVVDEFARTSNLNIVAAGDCTYHYNPIYQKHMRLESVQNANDQASVAAATICGQLEPYKALPWFWSDQYDMKMQIAGLSQGFDRVIIRGDISNGRSFSAFYILGDQLLAVDAVNQPQAFMFGKKNIGTDAIIDIESLHDESVDFKQLLS